MNRRAARWLRRGLVTAVAAGLVAPLHLSGQEGNQSDVSGASTTTSTTASGAFTSPGATTGGAVQGQPGQAGGPAGGPGAAAPGAVNASALTSTASSVQGQLSAGSFSAATPGAGAVSLPSTAQGVVAAVMAGSASPSALDGVLGSGPGGVGSANLSTAIHGLLANPTPAQLLQALQAFNQVVEASEPGFLAEPTPEFIAVREVLSRMAGAVSAAGG